MLGWRWFWNQKILSNLTPLKWYRRFDFVKITSSVTHCKLALVVRAYLYLCGLGAQVTYSIFYWVNIVTYLSGSRRDVDWSTLTLWDLSVALGEFTQVTYCTKFLHVTQKKNNRDLARMPFQSPQHSDIRSQQNGRRLIGIRIVHFLRNWSRKDEMELIVLYCPPSFSEKSYSWYL